LLLIGAAHAILLWYGDILVTYALLGFALLLFRRRTDKTLLIWAAVLFALVPLVIEALPLITERTGPEATEQVAAKEAAATATNEPATTAAAETAAGAAAGDGKDAGAA